MKRAKLIGSILGAIALGYFGGTWERSAVAAAADGYVGSVNGVDVHRVSDTAAFCYVASVGISCVKR